MRKVLNPNLISKKEQREVKILVKEMFDDYPYEQARKDTLKELKRERVHRYP